MRVSSRPVDIPASVRWSRENKTLVFKSDKGELTHVIHDYVDFVESDGKFWFAPVKGADNAKALAGTTRSLVNNLVIGLAVGFEKKLELKGVGYRAKLDGQTLVLSLGKSHQDKYQAPEGVKISVLSQTEVVVSGVRKDLVCQVAANIRSFRKPEPYKGKGIRYANEKIILKEVKK